MAGGVQPAPPEALRGNSRPRQPRPMKRAPSGLLDTSSSQHWLGGYCAGPTLLKTPQDVGIAVCPQSGGEREAQNMAGLAQGHSWFVAEQA